MLFDSTPEADWQRRHGIWDSGRREPGMGS